MKETVAICISPKTKECLDKMVETEEFRNRSDAAEKLMLKGIEKLEDEKRPLSTLLRDILNKEL